MISKAVQNYMSEFELSNVKNDQKKMNEKKPFNPLKKTPK